MSLRFVPLPAPLPDVETLATGALWRRVCDEPESFPCRRCLRDAEPGEELLLLTYDPFLGTSPYRQPGPIYVHADGCAPDPADLAATPAQLSRRQLSVRAFDGSHGMVTAEVTEGTGFASVAHRLLDKPHTAYLHVHNAAPGCFAVRVESGSAGGGISAGQG